MCISSGQTSFINQHPFRFYCYGDFDRAAWGNVVFPKQVMHNIQNGLGLVGRSSFPVNQQYLYVFRKRGEKASIYIEAYANQGDFQLVDWKDPERCKEYQKGGERIPQEKTQRIFHLRGQETYYVFLCQRPLSIDRIAYYGSHHEHLEVSSVKIVVGNEKPSQYPKVRYLPLVEECTRYLKTKVDEFYGYMDPKNSPKVEQKRMTLGLVTHAVLGSDSPYQDQLLPDDDFHSLSRWIKAFEEDNTKKETTYKLWEERFSRWRRFDYFQHWRDDLASSCLNNPDEKPSQEELDLMVMILRLDNEFVRLNDVFFLKYEAEKKGSWYTTTGFQYVRRMAQFVDQADLLSAVYPFLAKGILYSYFCLTIRYKCHQIALSKLCDKVNDYLIWFKKSSSPFPSLKNKTYAELISLQNQGTYIATAGNPDKFHQNIFSPDAEVRQQAKQSFGKGLPTGKDGMAFILFAIECANTQSCLEQLALCSEKNEFYNQTALVGAYADLIASMEYFVQNTPIQRFIINTLGRHFFSVANVVGNVTTMICAAMDYNLAIQNKNYGLALGQLFIYSGATVGLGCTALLIMGASLGPWGLIAVGLFLLGAFLVNLFSESELETYARLCPWGEDANKYIENTTEEDIDRYLRQLFEILSEGSLDISLTQSPNQEWIPSHQEPLRNDPKPWEAPPPLQQSVASTTAVSISVPRQKPEPDHRTWKSGIEISIQPTPLMDAAAYYQITRFKVTRKEGHGSVLGTTLYSSSKAIKLTVDHRLVVPLSQKGEVKEDPRLYFCIPQEELLHKPALGTYEEETEYQYEFYLQFCAHHMKFPEKPKKFEGPLMRSFSTMWEKYSPNSPLK